MPKIVFEKLIASEESQIKAGKTPMFDSSQNAEKPSTCCRVLNASGPDCF